MSGPSASQPGDAERLEALPHVAEPLRERRHLGVQRDEHESRQRLHAERRQRHRLAVERREAAGLGHGRELPVLAVRPPVVRTAQHLRAAPRAGQDLHRAVTADVGERPQLAVVAAHDRNRLAGHVGGRERAGLGHHALGADEDPGAREDAVHLRVEGRLLHVGAGGQGDALLVGDAHAGSSEAMACRTSARARARPMPPSSACCASPSTSAHSLAALAPSSAPPQARTWAATSSTQAR